MVVEIRMQSNHESIQFGAIRSWLDFVANKKKITLLQTARDICHHY